MLLVLNHWMFYQVDDFPIQFFLLFVHFMSIYVNYDWLGLGIKYEFILLPFSFDCNIYMFGYIMEMNRMKRKK